eukprot:CAMPEP_0181239312 /NCGR_PEP_ID=MMETSP1096-20121128/39863_1 /TAXON_ID=156174 ORGANISM="Chrysochromulina ericina, Strain CCMP281" /NCGR_SAMPLE_ID=MMETSP1096 /ASSEMBLY_ACC=CAM_ASM_000453 /LENGTH=44 /DNA_ID= /DNA_START= /DNA_END= /DNA_ORIENTATION=
MPENGRRSRGSCERVQVAWQRSQRASVCLAYMEYAVDGATREGA